MYPYELLEPRSLRNSPSKKRVASRRWLPTIQRTVIRLSWKRHFYGTSFFTGRGKMRVPTRRHTRHNVRNVNPHCDRIKARHENDVVSHLLA